MTVVFFRFFVTPMLFDIEKHPKTMFALKWHVTIRFQFVVDVDRRSDVVRGYFSKTNKRTDKRRIWYLPIAQYIRPVFGWVYTTHVVRSTWCYLEKTIYKVAVCDWKSETRIGFRTRNTNRTETSELAQNSWKLYGVHRVIRGRGRNVETNLDNLIV